jgi:hypothetical protein
MTEDFLQFIWKYGLFDCAGMVADTGEEVQVIALGEHNSDAGPDFLNARIKIGPTVWAGNVEIHVRSSEWTAHRHHEDRAYDNVILHAVYQNDQAVKRTNGEIIPGLELHFNKALYDNYRNLLCQKEGLPCHQKIERVEPFLFDLWLNSLVVERIQQKSRYVHSLLTHFKNNWEEVFYISLARSFGFGLNAAPFEMTARSLSWLHLARHRGNPLQLEAMFFGQAGFLEESRLFSDYPTSLLKEYLHLRNLYGLRPVDKHLWKFLRLRPVNFPTIRLSQFAALLNKSEGLFSRVLECTEIRDLHQYFDVQASSFWDTHYTFDTASPQAVKRLGNEAFYSVIINTVVPLLFHYGKLYDREYLKEKALNWLDSIPPEKNRIIRRWENHGRKIPTAFYSQGILQLVNTYCNRKRCLACSIGASIITAVPVS